VNVVILGATSHIAKGLIARFLSRSTDRLYLFSRSGERVREFVGGIWDGPDDRCTVSTGYADFAGNDYDVIINCVGVETRNSHNCDFTRYFSVTEEFDGRVLDYLKRRNPEAVYFSFSSGAVYGKGFAAPAGEDSVNAIRVNRPVREDCYGIARINAEAKHRAHAHLRIIDLRVFSYFSRYINLEDGYFITDLINSILGGSVLVTDDTDMVRDYLHPDDLFAMMKHCLDAGHLNTAFDVYSAGPVSKQAILDHFASEYGLRYQRRPSGTNASATGGKANYYSTWDRAAQIGYVPHYTSMDTLSDEARYILRPIAVSKARRLR
jgi:nucleoside-diphosphate-sugar epimerase